MFTLAIPVILNHKRFEEFFPTYLNQFKETGASRVFLVVSNALADEKEKTLELNRLRKYSKILRENGIEPGVWFVALGHGGTCFDSESEMDKNRFVEMIDLHGNKSPNTCCPLDPEFIKESCKWVQELGKAGAEIILLDDDFRVSIRNGTGFCCCENHKKEIEKISGEPFDSNKILDALFYGAPNKLRDSFTKAQGNSLTNYAKKLRAALDEVTPEVRLAHCAVMSTWDQDGTDNVELAKAFAGNTKPLMRLIGAPYWAAVHAFEDVHLGNVVDYERLQCFWCEDEDIEVFAEGDCYPRFRNSVPSAYLECFDQIMRASGSTSGILKYMIDYYTSPKYDNGYISRHIKNIPKTKEIQEKFMGKKAVGVRIFEPVHTYLESTDPGRESIRYLPASIRFASENNIPTCFSKNATSDPTIVFGQAALKAEYSDFESGAIIDSKAAKILLSRGIDIGLKGVGGRINASSEYYCQFDDEMCLMGGVFQKLDPEEGAVVLSHFSDTNEPAMLITENKKGQKFIILSMIADESHEGPDAVGLFKSYYRAETIKNNLPVISGRPSSVRISTIPGIYALAKADEQTDKLTVGLWNISEDYAENIHITDKSGDTITVPYIEPFGVKVVQF